MDKEHVTNRSEKDLQEESPGSVKNAATANQMLIIFIKIRWDLTISHLPRQS
ncbi:MAG: hypothetical protein LBI95_04015 [Holosporales bacterium]|jgi:hypothetical protein|nr:hypothetical protein [Holosporales bacterium]